MASDTFCFPPHEGLPDLVDPSKWGQPPTVNGYIEPDLGVTTPELETGWTRSGRITYVGDAGLPQMVFQGLKHNSQDYLYLSFMVRFDTGFNTTDQIILVFHPTVTSARSADHRRIDIRPLTATTGAGTVSDPADPDDRITTDPVHYRIRTNRGPQGVTFYKFNTGTPTIPPFWDSTDPINNIVIKVRSWEPEIVDPLVSNNHNWSVEIKLPLTKALAAVPATATNPGDPAGDNWINFTNDFGFYFNVIRICSGPTCTLRLDTAANFQYTWPRANYVTGQGLIKDPTGGPIAIEQHLTTATNAPAEANWPDWLGHGLVGASATACRGVRFVGGANGIGIVNPASPAGSLLGTIDARNISPTPQNTFAARIINDGTTAADLVNATFRIARWGIGPGGNADWAKIPTNIGSTTPATNKNPTDPSDVLAPGHSIGAGAQAQLEMKWGLSAADRTLWTGHGGDQCLWVLLDSAAPAGVNFTESSVRRNLSFLGLSAQDREAEISGKWQPAPAGGAPHEFLLLVSQRLLVTYSDDRGQTVSTSSPDDRGNIADARRQPNLRAEGGAVGQRGDDRGWQSAIGRVLEQLESAISGLYSRQEPTYTWLVINNAYRRTEDTLTLDGTPHRLYEPGGSFAYVAEHTGNVSDWKYTIDGGPEVATMAEGDAYSIQAPDNGATTIRTRLEAAEPPVDARGCLQWFLFLPLVIVRVLRRLLS